MTKTCVVGNLALAALDIDSAAHWIRSRARDEVACVVVTSNIHHLRLAEIDEEFRDALHEAELNVGDGWPLVLAARLLRGPSLPGRVAGVDLVDRILNADERFRVAILGGPPGGAAELARKLSRRHDVVLVDSLPRGTWDTTEYLDELCHRLDRRRPNLALVAIGAPQQELLAQILRPFVSGPILCCGASVEILAGLRPRAPRVLQAVGLEWLFRAVMEPRRLLPRYARSGAYFVYILGRELASGRQRVKLN